MTDVGGSVRLSSSGGGGPATFDALTDTPASKIGQAGLIPVVNATEDALEYKIAGGVHDNVSPNYYAFKGATEFEDGTLFLDIVEGRNASSLPFYAPTLTSDVGTIELGGAITIKVGGENVNFTDEIDNETFNPLWVKQGIGEHGFQRDTPGPAIDKEYETSKAEILVNPFWSVTMESDHRTIAYTFEVDTTITNVLFSASKGGTPFYEAPLGTLTADVETTVDLTASGRTSVDVFKDQIYDLELSSPDGDVRAKGSLTNPFFKASILDFTDLQVPTENDYAMESISTSVIRGGDITFNSATTVDIAEALVRIVYIDRVTGLADVRHALMPEQIGLALPDIATQVSTRIGVNEFGEPVQLPFTMTPQTIRSYANLGYALHHDGAILGAQSIFNDKLQCQEHYSQLVDALDVLGVTRKTGFGITPNANLSFAVASGTLQAPGAGIGSGDISQNLSHIPAKSPATFATILGKTDDVVLTSTGLIDPGFWDDGTGTKVAIVAPSNATILYLYQGIGGILYVMYGQTLYQSVDEAELNNLTDAITYPEEISARSNLIARVVVRANCDDLTDPAQAVWLTGVKFGAGLSGVSFGAGAGGGDVHGPALSVVNEIPTFADTTGKVIQDTSDVTALAGVMTRGSANGELKLARNGTGSVNIGDRVKADNVGTTVTGRMGMGDQVANATDTVIVRDPSSGNSTRYSIKAHANKNAVMDLKTYGTGQGLFRFFDEDVMVGSLANAGNNVLLDATGNVKVTAKTIINSTNAATTALQVNNRPTDLGGFTEDLDAPFSAHDTVHNGGATPAVPKTTALLTRAGVSGQSFANMLRVDLSRYEDVGTNARTQVDFRLSHGSLTTEDNDTPIIMSLRSNGDVEIGDFLFSETGEISLKNADELYFGDYIVLSAHPQVDIDARTHVLGELFHNTTTLKNYQVTGLLADIEAIGNVVSDAPITGSNNKIMAFSADNGREVNALDVQAITPSPGLTVIQPVLDGEIRIVPVSTTKPIIVGSARMYGDNMAIGGLRSTEGASLEGARNDQALILNRGTSAERNSIINPKTGMIYYNITTDTVDRRTVNGEWRPLAAADRSFHCIIGADNVQVSHQEPEVFYDRSFQDLGVSYYKIDGVNASHGDYVANVLTLPATAPTGLYRIGVSSRNVVFDGLRDALVHPSVNASNYRVYPTRNGVKPGFQAGGDSRLPLIHMTPYEGGGHDSCVNWFAPGDEIGLWYDVAMTSGDFKVGKQWELIQTRFEISYVGPE